MLVALSLALASAPYARFPDLHGDTIVFTAEGDLWAVGTDGHSPRRLTAHAGTERQARFSPDGQWIAFSGEYDGNIDVYVIPARGGEPRRLTWHAMEDQVLGWTPDGRSVVFRSKRADPNGRTWSGYTVAAAGGEPELLDIGWCAWLDIDPASGRYAFTRAGRESATWKRYRGGSADDIWVGDPRRQDFVQATSFAGMDAFPMWYAGNVYFLSDQGGTGRIWGMRADGTERAALTNNTEWDARWPSMAPDGRIIYVLGGDLHIYDVTTSRDTRVPVELPGEGQLVRTRYLGAEGMTAWDLSPDGKRLLVTTRGEVWSVPTTKGVSVPVTHDSPARESWAGFSGDGDSVWYITDASGEEAVATRDAWGRGAERIGVAAGKSGWHFPPAASPDGRWVAWGDERNTLYLVAATGGPVVPIVSSEQWEISDYTWSPDGRWLAWSMFDRRDFSSVWIYDTTNRTTHRVTTGTTIDYGPAWDPEGRYLYFLGDRHVNPVLGVRDFEYVVTEPTQLYAVLLRPDVPDPFAPVDGLPAVKGDEEEEEEEEDEETMGDKDSTKEKKAEVKPVAIAIEGLGDRIVRVPVPPGRYGGLAATKESLYFLSYPVRGMVPPEGGLPPGDATLHSFNLEKKKLAPFLSGVMSFLLARDAPKIAILRAPGDIVVVDATAPPTPEVLAEAAVHLGDVVVALDPRAEWRQMYFEAWRLARDFHWEATLGGLDWVSVRDRYATLLPRLRTRAELTDLIGETIGELATSHTYVSGGDPGAHPVTVATGMLGAEFVRDGNAWRIARLYRGDPADEVVAPLLAPGVAAKEGEYLIAVNHRAPDVGETLEAMLAGHAGKPLVLTIAADAKGARARDVVAVPTGDDRPLRYADWVRRNREYVAKMTGGRVGYLHIPNMGTSGLVAFDTWFYPQLDKSGLVVDCRWNGGGFVSQLILERLDRRLLGLSRARGGNLGTYPAKVLNGPFVVLTNEYAGSDGDILPHMVQRADLAPVIGVRSWGGVVGIRSDKPLVDGGMVTQPEFANYYPGEGWALENHGVDPDIVVVNRPQDLARDQDPQLDRAITEVLGRMATTPPVPMEFDAPRVKTREAFGKEEK